MHEVKDKNKAFLDEIIKHPDDDGVRLIYADWLEEHGGQPERAEFIRAQVALAAGHAGGIPLTRQRREEMEFDCNILAGRHPEWLAPLGKLGTIREISVVYQRGMPEKAILDGDRFLAYAEDLLNPRLRESQSGTPAILERLQVRPEVGWPSTARRAAVALIRTRHAIHELTQERPHHNEAPEKGKEVRLGSRPDYAPRQRHPFHPLLITRKFAGP